MKLTLLSLCCLAISYAAYYEQRFVDVRKALEQTRQKSNHPEWEAGLNEFFKGKSLRQIGRLMGQGVNRNSSEQPSQWPANRRPKFPDNFDSRNKVPICRSLMSIIRTQGMCDSDWAISSASVMSDRTCVASNGMYRLPLSQEELLSCCKQCGRGCHGGSPLRALQYWVIQGVPTGGQYKDQSLCKPYTIPPCMGDKCTEQKTPPCTFQCTYESNRTLLSDRIYGKQAFRIWDGEQAMMQEIQTYGPIVANFIIYEDILYYKAGIYHHVKGKQLGGQSVRIVGWGVESGRKYWLVANSWSTLFGERGWIKIRRGENECQIESNAYAAYPL